MVNAHDRKTQDYIVAQILGKEGTDGTVDHTGSQNCLLRGLTLSAQIAAGNSAHGIELLVEIHRQGQEVDAVTGLRGGCGGGQDGRFSIADEAGAIGQACHFSGFHTQGSAGKGGLKHLVVLEFELFGCNHFIFLSILGPCGFST